MDFVYGREENGLLEQKEETELKECIVSRSCILRFFLCSHGGSVRSFSSWHRRSSTTTYVPADRGQTCTVLV